MGELGYDNAEMMHHSATDRPGPQEHDTSGSDHMGLSVLCHLNRAVEDKLLYDSVGPPPQGVDDAADNVANSGNAAGVFGSTGGAGIIDEADNVASSGARAGVSGSGDMNSVCLDPVEMRSDRHGSLGVRTSAVSGASSSGELQQGMRDPHSCRSWAAPHLRQLGVVDDRLDSGGHLGASDNIANAGPAAAGIGDESSNVATAGLAAGETSASMSSGSQTENELVTLLAMQHTKTELRAKAKMCGVTLGRMHTTKRAIALEIVAAWAR